MHLLFDTEKVLLRGLAQLQWHSCQALMLGPALVADEETEDVVWKGELGLWRYMHWGSPGIEGMTKSLTGKGKSFTLDLGWASNRESGITPAHLWYHLSSLLPLPGTCMASHLQGTCSSIRGRQWIATCIQPWHPQIFKNLIQSLDTLHRHKGLTAFQHLWALSLSCPSCYSK